jgi:4-hydroxy-tetrahydrodipicolinate reductase
MIKAAVAGACGRMGTAIIKAISSTDGIELAGALEHSEHLLLGQKIDIPGVPSVDITAGVETVSGNADVLIDFTNPEIRASSLPKA